MPTLVIHTPRRKSEVENARDFDTTCKKGIGDGYAIRPKLFAQINPGCRVAVICKDSQQRFEAELVKLVPVEKTTNGIMRYEVHFRNGQPVPYKNEPLDRFGVAVV